MVTLLPSKNLKGLGSLEFAVVGKVVGTLQVAWRSSTRGAAKADADRSEKAKESFMLMSRSMGGGFLFLVVVNLQQVPCFYREIVMQCLKTRGRTRVLPQYVRVNCNLDLVTAARR